MTTGARKFRTRGFGHGGIGVAFSAGRGDAASVIAASRIPRTFDLGGVLRGSERWVFRCSQPVDEPEGERCLWSMTVSAGVRGRRGTSASMSVTRPVRSARIPRSGIPGAATHSSVRSSCLKLPRHACSRPPLPTSNNLHEEKRPPPGLSPPDRCRAGPART